MWSLVGLRISPSVPHYGGGLPSGLLLSPDCSGELLQPHGILLFGNILAHVGVGLDVLHLVVIHDTEIAIAERLGHC